MFGNKSFSQVKTALIKAGKIEADATDAEVAQAAIDVINADPQSSTQDSKNTEGGGKKEGDDTSKKEDVADKKEDKKEGDTEQKSTIESQITALTALVKQQGEQITKLTTDVQVIAKSGQKSSVATEQGTQSTEKPKERAYMTNPINKGVTYAKSETKTGKIPLLTDDNDDEE